MKGDRHQIRLVPFALIAAIYGVGIDGYPRLAWE